MELMSSEKHSRRWAIASTEKGKRTMASLDPIQQIKDRIEAERHRVAQLLRRDRDDDESDRLRVQAILEIDDGKFVNIQDTVLGPTREQLANSEYISFTPRGRDGTIR